MKSLNLILVLPALVFSMTALAQPQVDFVGDTNLTFFDYDGEFGCPYVGRCRIPTLENLQTLRQKFAQYRVAFAERRAAAIVRVNSEIERLRLEAAKSQAESGKNAYSTMLESYALAMKNSVDYQALTREDQEFGTESSYLKGITKLEAMVTQFALGSAKPEERERVYQDALRAGQYYFFANEDTHAGPNDGEVAKLMLKTMSAWNLVTGKSYEIANQSGSDGSTFELNALLSIHDHCKAKGITEVLPFTIFDWREGYLLQDFSVIKFALIGPHNQPLQVECRWTPGKPFDSYDPSTHTLWIHYHTKLNFSIGLPGVEGPPTGAHKEFVGSDHYEFLKNLQ